MRASRLLALLLRLQRRGGASAPVLARELEVSVRTVYRDVEALAQAGVPVWTETGLHGGIRLTEGWSSRLEGMTGEEVGALGLAGTPQMADQLGLATLAAAARTKLDASLPAELRGRASRLRERLHVDVPAWFETPPEVPALPKVAEAVWSGRKLDLRYGPERKARRVEPLGLVAKGGAWYLIARHRSRLRSYRVDRIASAQPRSEGFTRPEGFSLEGHWRQASAEFEASLLRWPCTLRLTESGARLLPVVAPHALLRERIAAVAPDGAGIREVTLPLEGEEVAAGQLLALGREVEVVAPPSLRRRLALLAREVAAHHARGR